MKRRKFFQAMGMGTTGLGLLASKNAQAFPQPARTIQPKNPNAPLQLSVANERKVLIVGGGIAGLSAALELAERGYNVSIREADSILGGRLATRTLETGAGTFKVEHGLHTWFNNYHVFQNIRNRLNINSNFRDYNTVHFKFRTYKPEALESTPPIYPLNLLSIIGRSPNLNIFDAATQLGLVKDVMLYNHNDIYNKYDGITFVEWSRKAGVNKAFYDVLMEPASSVTLNDADKISAAEMLMYMHFFFIGQPKAFNREVTTVDHDTAIITPWANRLKKLGVKIELNNPVKGLEFVNGKAVGEVGQNEEFDWVILACDVNGTKKVLEASHASDETSAKALGSLKARIAQMRAAPPYKVLRVWLDKQPEGIPDVLETPQHKPINLLAQFQLLEKESAEWAEKTGGSVIEFHLYNSPQLVDVPDDRLWDHIRPVALELMPDLANANVLGQTVGSYDNFSSFEVGQGTIRPYADFAQKVGLANVSMAGDWIQTGYPSALMERAVCTGREAANLALLSDNVRQAPLVVTSSHGPGLI